MSSHRIMSNQSLQSALLKAAKVGHFKLMQELIQLGADPCQSDIRGNNAITYFAQANPKEMTAWFKAKMIEASPGENLGNSWVKDLMTTSYELLQRRQELGHNSWMDSNHDD